MKKKTKKKNKKGLLFRIVKNGFKKKLDKFEIIGSENIPDEPSLIIGNHAQMHGPIFAEVNFPYNRTTWCMGCMHHLKEIPPYIIDDFWPYKKKGTVWFYKFLSWLLAPLCHYIFTNADTIGVYKDARGITTFKNSILALEEEKHIIIFPECHTKYNNIINEFQDKFIDLAKLYYKSTKKELSFVPVYIAPTIKTIIYGKPIKYNHNEDICIQRKTICDYLKNKITSLAKSLPLHTVIPYENIKKKNYPKSK